MYPRPGSNRHAFKGQGILSPSCLPIPPLKIDRKLQKIYDLIDKIRGTVDKADLPNSDDTVEGIIASGAAGSQSPSGIGFSIGTNKDNEQIEAVYEAWEDAKVDWVMKQLEKIKQGYRNLKESIKLQNEEIAPISVASPSMPSIPRSRSR